MGCGAAAAAAASAAAAAASPAHCTAFAAPCVHAAPPLPPLPPLAQAPQRRTLRPHPGGRRSCRCAPGQVGDGTTSVVVLAGELLREAELLVNQKIHPMVIIAGGCCRRCLAAAAAAALLRPLLCSGCGGCAAAAATGAAPPLLHCNLLLRLALPRPCCTAICCCCCCCWGWWQRLQPLCDSMLLLLWRLQWVGRMLTCCCRRCCCRCRLCGGWALPVRHAGAPAPCWHVCENQAALACAGFREAAEAARQRLVAIAADNKADPEVGRLGCARRGWRIGMACRSHACWHAAMFCAAGGMRPLRIRAPVAPPAGAHLSCRCLAGVLIDWVACLLASCPICRPSGAT